MSRRARGLGSGFRTVVRPVLLSILASSLVGCFSERPTGPSGGGTVSFANDVQPIFTANCASSGCHGTQNANPAGKPMVLAAGQAYDAIVGVFALQLTTMQRIQASQPDNSYLIHKLQGTHRGVGGTGSPMPLGRPALSQAQIELIRSWVTQGARRN